MKKTLFFLLFSAIVITSCKQERRNQVSFASPEAGTTISPGAGLTIDLQFGANKIDSVVYLIDSAVIASKKDTENIKLNTSELSMGNHLVRAKLYSSGSENDISSNIVVDPTAVYDFKVINIYPHDTSSYVEGLEYHNGLLYESDGEYIVHGGSSLRVVEPETGRIVKKTAIDSRYFAEGISVIGDKIIQLTWKEGVGFVYDKNTLKKLSEFPYRASSEGWGLCFDGKRLLNTDGSDSIIYLNKQTYQKEGSLKVSDINGPVNSLNELEFIDGKIYANVYQKPVILIINPQTGIVEGRADLSSLLPEGDNADYVLNGIAWDAAGRRLFITGKLWNKLYEIKLIKR